MEESRGETPSARWARDVEQRERRDAKLIFWGLWVGVATLIVVLAWPALQQERPRHRPSIKNQLKQFGIAAANYADDTGRLPASTRRDDGTGMHGWQTFLLPFVAVEQSAAYDLIDFQQPWDADDNRKVFETVVPLYLRPDTRPWYSWEEKLEIDPQTGYAISEFAANKHVIDFEPGMTFEEITDGLSVTLLFGEIRENLPPWGKPGNGRDPGLGINASSDGFGGFSKGGASFVLADGSVTFIDEGVDKRVLEALATPSGAETISRGEF